MVAQLCVQRSPVHGRPRPWRLTPAVVHSGQAETVLAARQAVLDAAHAAHPERFVHRPPRPLALPAEVWMPSPAGTPSVTAPARR
jgi:hypothetical protein